MIGDHYIKAQYEIYDNIKQCGGTPGFPARSLIEDEASDRPMLNELQVDRYSTSKTSCSVRSMESRL